MGLAQHVNGRAWGRAWMGMGLTQHDVTALGGAVADGLLGGLIGYTNVARVMPMCGSTLTVVLPLWLQHMGVVDKVYYSMTPDPPIWGYFVPWLSHGCATMLEACMHAWSNWPCESCSPCCGCL